MLKARKTRKAAVKTQKCSDTSRYNGSDKGSLAVEKNKFRCGNRWSRHVEYNIFFRIIKNSLTPEYEHNLI